LEGLVRIGSSLVSSCLKIEYKRAVNFKYGGTNSVFSIIWCQMGAGCLEHQPGKKYVHNETGGVPAFLN
jgi:hypothetical protein